MCQGPAMGMSWGEAGVADGLDDATRDACLHGLGDHYAAGRLSAAELDARVQLVLAAETEDELASVMAGLATEPAGDQEVPAPRPGRSRARRVLRAVLGFLAHRTVGGRSRTRSEEPPAESPPAAATPDSAPRGDDTRDDVLEPDVPAPVDAPRAGPATGGIVPRRVRLNGGVIPSQRDGD